MKAMLEGTRIVIVHPGNPVFDYRLKKTVEGLSDAGAEVIVVAYLSRPENDIKDWACTSGCRLRPYTMLKASNNKIWLLRVLWNLTVLRVQSIFERRVDECEGLLKVALEYKPDLLYFINIESIEEAQKAILNKINIPIIYEAYEYYPSLLANNLYFNDEKRNRKFQKMEKEVCSSPYVNTIVVSEDIAKGYSKRYGCVLPQVIHNVAPRAISEVKVHDKTPVFYFQSYLRPTYSIERLVDAFLDVQGEAKLIIQGNAHEDGYWESLESYIASKDVHSVIKLEPACPYDKVVETAAQYDIGLITVSAKSLGPLNESIVYAMQNKMFTYASAGLAIIASDYPSQSKFIIDGQCGLVYVPDDYACLTNAMQYCVDHPERVREMRKASLAMGQKYSLENEMNALALLCSQAMQCGDGIEMNFEL